MQRVPLVLCFFSFQLGKCFHLKNIRAAQLIWPNVFFRYTAGVECKRLYQLTHLSAKRFLFFLSKLTTKCTVRAHIECLCPVFVQHTMKLCWALRNSLKSSQRCNETSSIQLYTNKTIEESTDRQVGNYSDWNACAESRLSTKTSG